MNILDQLAEAARQRVEKPNSRPRLQRESGRRWRCRRVISALKKHWQSRGFPSSASAKRRRPPRDSSHRIFRTCKLPENTKPPGRIIVITISGRGDKDCAAIARYRGEDFHE